MNKDKYVYASLVGFLDNNIFRYLVDTYQGDRNIKSFSCWNQLLSMKFGQLCNRKGLRNLLVALEAQQGNLYHLGISVTHSIFIQAKELCEAGIDIEKAINYLESRFLPTGYDKEKLKYEVNRSYSKNAEMFGMKRGDYKPYSEYKKSKSNSN